MTGFIRGLFGSKPTDSVEEKAVPEKKAPAPKPEAFYLDMADARTMGNTEYMKTSKTVRRTFPKTLDQPEELELIQQVSAMDRIVEGETQSTMVSPFGSVVPEAAPEAAPEAPKAVAPAEERRSADSSMDMFRSMARDIKKK